MGNFTQNDRPIRTGDQPLGKDVLLVDRFEGEEAVSAPFEFRVNMRSANLSIAPAQLVGKPLTISIDRTDNSGAQRYFNGIVTRFENLGQIDRNMSLYTAVMRPWFWLLSQTADCRIFQEKNALDIVKLVLGESGYGPFQSKVSAIPPTREYCVQYNESDFAFVSRLLEEEGIYYYFLHSNSQHVMVLGDDAAALGDSAESKVSFQQRLPGAAQQDRLKAWAHGYELRPGKWAHTDYDFKKPTTNLLADASASAGVPPMPKLDVFEWPGIYKDQGVGQKRATVRADQAVSGYDTVRGQSTVEAFAPGLRFAVGEHNTPSESGKKFILREVRHKAQQSGAYAASGGEDPEAGPSYQNDFVAIPETVKLRPARTTIKPRIPGPQTAVVVGPKGNEIWTDPFGCIKVQFFWDRYGKKDDQSSCWIRVASSAAGGTFGYMSIPRVGQEVVVAFLDGDPDRPLVTGVVYNADMTQPLSTAGGTASDNSNVPAVRMMTTLRSNSLGRTGGFNEITMNDTSGKEGLFFKAQKDEVHLVGHDRKDTVTNNETRKVGVDRSREVGNNEKIKIGNNRDETVGTNETVNIGSNRSLTVGSDDKQQVNGNQSISVVQKQTQTAMEITITAQTQFTIQCGASSIVLTPATATISAPMVLINS